MKILTTQPVPKTKTITYKTMSHPNLKSTFRIPKENQTDYRKNPKKEQKKIYQL